MNTKTVTNVCIVCDDNLPLSEIPVKGEHFTMTWTELVNGISVPRHRRLGIEARALVGISASDPPVVNLMMDDATP